MNAGKEPPLVIRRQCTRCGHMQLVPNGAWSRWLRVRAGIGLRELARRCKLSASHLSDVEHNRRNASPRVVAAYHKHCRSEQQ